MFTELPSNRTEESARTRTMEPSALMLATELGRVATVSPTNNAEERSTLFVLEVESLSFTVNMAELAATRKVGASSMAARSCVLNEKRTIPIPGENLSAAIVAKEKRRDNYLHGY